MTCLKDLGGAKDILCTIEALKITELFNDAA